MILDTDGGGIVQPGKIQWHSDYRLPVAQAKSAGDDIENVRVTKIFDNTAISAFIFPGFHPTHSKVYTPGYTINEQ